MCAVEQTAVQATPKLASMPRPKFIYLSVEAFRKLTRIQKQEYVVVLKNHLDLPIGGDTADPPQRSLDSGAPKKNQIVLNG